MSPRVGDMVHVRGKVIAAEHGTVRVLLLHSEYAVTADPCDVVFVEARELVVGDRVKYDGTPDVGVVIATYGNEVWVKCRYDAMRSYPAGALVRA